MPPPPPPPPPSAPGITAHTGREKEQKKKKEKKKKFQKLAHHTHDHDNETTTTYNVHKHCVIYFRGRGFIAFCAALNDWAGWKKTCNFVYYIYVYVECFFLKIFFDKHHFTCVYWNVVSFIYCFWNTCLEL
jgi:hypothetical protein